MLHGGERWSSRVTLGHMTMYLSNTTIRSTGYELVEFLDAPPVTDDSAPTPLDLNPDDEPESSVPGR